MGHFAHECIVAPIREAIQSSHELRCPHGNVTAFGPFGSIWLMSSRQIQHESGIAWMEQVGDGWGGGRPLEAAASDADCNGGTMARSKMIC